MEHGKVGYLAKKFITSYEKYCVLLVATCWLLVDVFELEMFLYGVCKKTTVTILDTISWGRVCFYWDLYFSK